MYGIRIILRKVRAIMEMEMASLAEIIKVIQETSAGILVVKAFALEDRMAGRTDQAMYTRVQNPTVSAFEQMMAAAEGAEAGVGFSSGMGAISATLMAFLRPGDRLACVEHVYPDSYRFMERILRPFGIAVDYHPLAAFEDDPELLKGVKVAYLESPTSVVFSVLNLPKVAAHAKRPGTITMHDNSWAPPVHQRPLAPHIDVAPHSA